MINYLTSFVNTDGSAFPNTKSINASGPSTTDGTEFIKLMIDDFWGFNQALMDYAGLTPDSVTEAPGTSQRIEAIIKGFAVGPGMAVDYLKDGDPSVNGDRVLLLQGNGVLRANYADLDAAVYVGDPDNPTAEAFYHADNSDGSSRNTAGIYLILADRRGYFIKRDDDNISVDNVDDNIALCKDSKAPGTNSGTFTAAGWRTRDLTLVENSKPWLSLGSNQITLQAGKYKLKAIVPAYATNAHRAKLRNITDSTDDIIGSSGYSSFSAAAANDDSTIKGILTLTAAKIFEIQHYCITTKTTNGFGAGAVTGGLNAIYTQVEIERISREDRIGARMGITY